MNIAIIGITGKSGHLIAAEAEKRGHQVTGIVRNKQKYNGSAIEKDIMSLAAQDLTQFDVVVQATGYWTPDTLHLHKDGLIHVAQLLRNTPTRLFVVGGASSLYMDQEHTIQHFNTPDFPEAYKPVASAMKEGLNALRTFSNVNWTYISPADEFDAEGSEGNEYQIGGEEFIANAEGRSYISYADYANAFVDAIENNNHTRQRLSVIQK